ncbi:phosphodiesterase-like [Pseudooceanicola batsensis HTCC2597]|uniref:Phosphodiesterase-like n=1 Tax=Pseudooceanicola batsensis (strain ATCC BAA-863 / DSM 15984 / KCTC 12145 / HTCC2597) TaxID=252305 RepID=A3TVR7_PSEBH|nr:glycerophosphodiester phosphodiesterase family protein [Pseudooceanicola batsensis]EAQ03713.1 phosphodiesterase-like [Pseudooceanicola batsensis HTCC2597]
MTLPEGFLRLPVAHRALHDVTDGRPENSVEAVRAAVAAGYAIEIDLQLSADGQAMVFHDYDLARLTGRSGPLQRKTAEELTGIPLLGGATGIPTFGTILAEVAGRVPLLVEIKDQDGALGPAVGRLEEAAARALEGYVGPVAVMSFNPNAVRIFGGLAPAVPVGLTTCAFAKADWQLIPAQRRERLRDIPDIKASRACFVSHDARDLANPRIAELKSRGMPVLAWTIRSPEAEAEARRIADNVTFEGYNAVIPA